MKPIQLPVPITSQQSIITNRQFLYSLFRALSSNSLAISAAGLGNSGITHFTLPALISSCAILQGLRECVSITGGAPPWGWRARSVATRMGREFVADPSIHFIVVS